MNAKIIAFLIAEATKAKKGKPDMVPATKSAPHYYEASVPSQSILSQEAIEIGKRKGTLLLKSYSPDMLLAEIRLDTENIFSDEALDLREEALTKCREILKKKGGKDLEQFSEEYAVYVVSNYSGDPEQFLSYRERIAAMLKSEKLELDQDEVKYTLSAQLKYAKNDLVFVDWDGAFVFDPDGDFESTLELFELANLQLLRYRILDKDLDLRLHDVVRLIREAPVKTTALFKAGDITRALKDAMFVRSLSISEFQDLEREIKLIGDWYSARLYDLVSKKFKLDEWRASIKDKLDAIEDVYSIASENFTISWERRGRIIEMIGWYVLLVGWLVLLILDIYFYKK